MRANPLFARLTHAAGWPSLAASAWMAAGLAILTLPLGLFDLDRVLNHAANPGLSSYLAGAAWLVAVALPPLGAISAANLAGRNTTGSEYDLLRLTRVSPAQIVAGFMGATFFRLRLAVIALAGLMPALILGSTASVVYDLIHQVLAAPVFGVPPMQYGPNMLDWLGVVAQISEVGLGLCLFALMSTAVGVALGLDRRSPIVSGLGAVGAMAGSMAAVITILAALHAPMSGVGVSAMPDPTLQIAVPALICLLPPGLLLPVVLWLARRRVFRGAK
jgi:hypothetical protein